MILVRKISEIPEFYYIYIYLYLYLAPTVSSYHPSDFLLSAAKLYGCRRQDLERAAGQSGRNDVTTDFPAPFEDISVSAFFLIALQWTWR